MNAATAVARILVVDDEAANVRALCDTLRDQGYDASGFTAGEEALQALRERQFDLLLTDLMMPGMDGVALLAAALKVDPQLVGVLMTGKGTIETAVAAMKAGALDYVLKPIKLNAILPVLSRAVGVRRLRLENLELRNTVAIHELNQAIAHTLDPNILLDKIVEAAIAQFEADEASIMLLVDEGHSLLIAAVRGEARDALRGTRVPVDEGVAGWVAAQREPLVLEGEVRTPGPLPLYPRAEIQSALSMPMITRDKLIGVLNVNCTRRRAAFAIGQVKVLSIFTHAAAAGIEAARLYEEQRRTDARYREVLHMAADAIVSLDQTQRIIVFNAGAEAIFGYAAGEAIGQPLDLLLPEGAIGAHRRHMESFAQGPDLSRPSTARDRLFGRRKDGTLIDVEVSISKRSENGKPLFTAVVRDITQRVQQEKRIARLTRLYAVLSGVNSTIVRIADETELFSEICRIAVDDGKFTCAWIGTFDPDTREIALVASEGSDMKERRFRLDAADPDGQGLLARAALEARVVWDNDLAARRAVGFMRRYAPDARAGAALPFVLDGSVKGLMLLYADSPGAFGEDDVSLLREMAGDVSFALDHIAKTRQVDYLATHDQLTGLPNRTLFNDRLEQRVSAARQDEKLFAVIVLDIERFRNINETLGRQAGDDLIRQLAQRMQRAIGETEILGRTAGDHFAIATRRADDAAGLARLAEQIVVGSLAQPFDTGGISLHLAARAGIAVYPADGANAEGLVRNAEAALRDAKRKGDKYQFYATRMNAAVADTLRLENRLRGALERDEFVLHYQPKVELDTGRVVSLEALIRWQDPETGLVPPMRFISLLEETGLIIEVGSWAMRRAVRTVAALRAKGLPPLRIAVNVSPIQLRQKDFVRAVEKAIAVADDGPHGLDIEITESVIMHDIEENVRKLKALRSMDVELAIDDFGTGYSSLAYIARLPVGVIKIDRAFITNLKDDVDNMSIVQTIISLTHALKRKVVAEGVETAEQAQLLRLLRCDQYQGYLFSKPLPFEQMTELLASSGIASTPPP
jgi:diguanylate cyclase (GGDEF)-like protein/PAS domain S-box-containing protein